ncbi:MAG: Plastocyanin [Candidatus Nitrosopelagicus brevis]|mgnify:FL=1|jgi:plastocyanin|nr:plastocyanin/azurin family copper-binding protein [Candidatus Nitrosopelagicus sp.]MEC7707601.1 plastocyanin/azurin family copper-binding protein [Thermoproteota archaeon]CAI8208208.1 MAG: Plastocyanin [Candidatus Nitrosopelagicus brevis]MEC9087335.1 plastocyanin/azurin family copper-binding protein [Thermoproteota archaeon]MEC9436017.1 plastocyanin/azurin family copper-binding protein [Thermoproteota archaeon]|tara:strand:+ start:1223 stop:1831 length:609 start_codon:yes stop_codon:yes gene_type:complete
MSEMQNPHNYRKVGWSMVLVAASLAAIGIVQVWIGPDVLFADDMQRDKTAFFEMCKAGNYMQEGCDMFIQPGNTLYEIPRMTLDDTEESTMAMEEPVAEASQVSAEIVSIPEGSGAPGCEETDECYIPATLNISAGTTVIWENNDAAAHLATSGTPDGGPDGVFDSGMIMGGATYEYEFSETGEFVYYCLVHPWMVGTVVVE